MLCPARSMRPCAGPGARPSLCTLSPVCNQHPALHHAPHLAPRSNVPLGLTGCSLRPSDLGKWHGLCRLRLTCPQRPLPSRLVPPRTCPAPPSRCPSGALMSKALPSAASDVRCVTRSVSYAAHARPSPVRPACSALSVRRADVQGALVQRNPVQRTRLELFHPSRHHPAAGSGKVIGRSIRCAFRSGAAVVAPDLGLHPV